MLQTKLQKNVEQSRTKKTTTTWKAKTLYQKPILETPQGIFTQNTITAQRGGIVNEISILFWKHVPELKTTFLNKQKTKKKKFIHIANAMPKTQKKKN